MRTKIDQAIEVLARKIGTDTEATDALKFTQAVLNLTHAKAILGNNKREWKRDKALEGVE